MGNPRKTQKPTKKPGQEQQAFMYFNISAEVTYVDQETPEGKVPNYKKEKVAILYAATGQGIIGKELAHIHAKMIMQFQKDYAQEYGQFNGVVPEAKRVVFLTFVLLGRFTPEQFEAGITFQDPGKSDKPEKKA